MGSSDGSSDVCSSDLPQTDRYVPANRLSTPQQTDGGVALEQIEQGAGRLPARPLQPAVTIHQQARVIGRDRQHRLDVFGRREAELRFPRLARAEAFRSEEHTSELQSLMRSSYAVF